MIHQNPGGGNRGHVLGHEWGDPFMDMINSEGGDAHLIEVPDLGCAVYEAMREAAFAEFAAWCRSMAPVVVALEIFAARSSR